MLGSYQVHQNWLHAFVFICLHLTTLPIGAKGNNIILTLVMFDPISISAYLAALLAITIWRICNKPKPIPIKGEGRKALGILGKSSVGKTTLYEQLNKNYTGHRGVQTLVNEVSAFEVHFDDGGSLEIEAGRDIGGDDLSRQKYYGDFLQKKDIIIYIFDLYLYLHDTNYEKSVNSDFDIINSNKKTNNRPEHIRVIPSHAEKFKNKKKYDSALKELRQKLINKDYRDIVLKDSIPLVDLTKDEQVKPIIEKLFKYK